jgi:hypothetical protein
VHETTTKLWVNELKLTLINFFKASKTTYKVVVLLHYKVKMHVGCFIWDEDTSYARLRTMVPKVIQNMVMPNPSVGSVARIISWKNVVLNVSTTKCMGIFKIIAINNQKYRKEVLF